ncbi:MAG: copper amine oxidase N-terminal domain-containing protein [Defluviitaleaceae bacterium]|nr:copper amine oxidase N-terminal domain-containing protein [Defluviitaleaceae bacterium]
MKKVSVALACMVLAIALGSEVISAEQSVSVSVNGSVLAFDQPAIIADGRTLVPLRAIFEELGANVDWDTSTQVVTAVKDDVTVTIQIGNDILVRNGEQITLDVPPQIVGGRALVPLRAIAESFGVEVDWEEITRTAAINGHSTGAGEIGSGFYDARYEFATGDISAILGINDYVLGEEHFHDLGSEFNVIYYVHWQSIDTLGQEIRLSHFGITRIGNIFDTQTGDTLFVRSISDFGSGTRGGPVEESRWLYVDIGPAENVDSTPPARMYRAFRLD